MVSKNIFEIGIGHVVVGRMISTKTVATGVFLVDVYCLGIKDAFYTERTHDELEYLTERMAGNGGVVDIAPECARKILDGAIAYAKTLGFPAHPDSVTAAALFGDIDAADCLTNYEFGKDGKPLYISGPNDTPARVRQVMRTLTASVGEGNFDYIVSARGL